MSNNLMGKDRLLQRLVSGALPCLLLGCSTVPMSPGTVLAQADSAKPPLVQPRPLQELPDKEGAGRKDSGKQVSAQSTMDSQLMFELMIAELAGRRGQLDVALAGYLRAAEHTDDPRVSERATRLAMYGQQWAEAEIAGQRWLTLEPAAADVRALLALAFLQQGKTDKAVEMYQQLISESDNSEQAVHRIQNELASSGDTAQAVVVMRAIVQSVPDSAQAHLALGSVLLTSDDSDGALAAVEDALRLDPENSNALLLKSRLLLASESAEEAFSDIDKVLARNPENLMLRLGYTQLLVETGSSDKAGEQLDQMYTRAEDNPDTLLTIGLLALDAQLPDQAQIYLEALAKTGVYVDQAHFYLARISEQRDDPGAAMAYYAAVGEGELHIPAQIRLAEMQGLDGDLKGGIDRLHQLASLDSDPKLQTQLLSAESRMLQQAGDGAAALRILSDGLERFPGNTDLLYARALTADLAGDSDMLVSDLNKLIESEPDNAHALNALGYHYADNNIELDRAEELLIKANELLPNDPAIMDSLGWLRFRQGQFSAAVAMLRSAYRLFRDPEIAAHLGEALWLNGSHDEARAVIDEALVQSPKDDRLLRVKQKYYE